MEGLRPVRRETLEDKIYRSLRRSILEGVLQGRLVQEDLATAFGTSRIPVRDALRRLHQEGLLIMDERGGYQVAPWGPADVEEIYDLRLLLEPEALRLAVPHLTPEDLAELEALQGELEEAAQNYEVEDYVELNRSFHFNLYERSQRRRLLQFIQALWSGLPPLTPLSVAGQMERSMREHRQLLQALKEGRVEEGIEVLRQHIARAKMAVLGRLGGKA